MTYQLIQGDLDNCRKHPSLIAMSDAGLQTDHDDVWLSYLPLDSRANNGTNASQAEKDAADAAVQEKIAAYAALPDPAYDIKRKQAYIEQLSEGAKTPEDTLGYVLDDALTKLVVIETAFSALKGLLVDNGVITQAEADAIPTAYAEFDDMLPVIAQIKADNPKPV